MLAVLAATGGSRAATRGFTSNQLSHRAVTMNEEAVDLLMPPLSLLEDTNLGGRELERCYKATDDGWSALDFHRQVDGRGSTLIIAASPGGARFGGYSPTGWESRDDYRATPRAFLFCSADSGGADEAERVWQRLAVLGPGDIAIFDYARGGPQFGAADLVIGPPTTPTMGGIAGPENDTPEYMQRTAGDLRRVSSSLGGSYERLPGGVTSLPDGPLVELEAYCNADFADGGGLRIGKAKKPADDEGDGGKPAAGWWPF